MPRWKIEPLSRSHQRRDFACGNESLDQFIRTLVSQYAKRDLGRTFVAVREGQPRVFGYYTLASGAVS
jgi:hypothetical protein